MVSENKLSCGRFLAYPTQRDSICTGGPATTHLIGRSASAVFRFNDKDSFGDCLYLWLVELLILIDEQLPQINLDGKVL